MPSNRLRALTNATDSAMVAIGSGCCQNSSETNCADALNTDTDISNACQSETSAETAAIPNRTPKIEVDRK